MMHEHITLHTLHTMTIPHRFPHTRGTDDEFFFHFHDEIMSLLTLTESIASKR